MATQRLDITGDLTSPGTDWDLFGAATRWQAIATTGTYGDSSSVWDSYIETDTKDRVSAFQFGTLSYPGEITQIILYALVYTEYEDDVKFEVYAGATKLGEVVSPAQPNGWVSGTVFVGSHTSNLNDIRLRITKTDVDDLFYYAEIGGVYLDVTYNLAAATDCTLSSVGVDVYTAESVPVSVGMNGVHGSSVVITPSDGGGGGSFSPTTVTITAGNTSGSTSYTPGSTGSKTISITNNASLTNPSNITLNVIADPNTSTYTAYASYSPTKFYKTIELSGSTANDFSGNASHGTLSGSIDYGQSGPGTLRAFKLNTTGQFLIPNFNMGGAAYSYVTWVKLTSVNTCYFLMRAPSGGWESGAKILFIEDTGGVAAYNQHGSSNFSSTYAMSSTSSWYHLAFTRSYPGNVHNYYINGVLRATSTFSVPSDDGSHITCVGRTGGNLNPLLFSCPMVFNKALTGTEVSNLYSGISASESPTTNLAAMFLCCS